MMQGEFTTDGKVEFSEVKSKARDMARLQAGMFMDRPDLWRKPPSPRKGRRPPEQQKLF